MELLKTEKLSALAIAWNKRTRDVAHEMVNASNLRGFFARFTDADCAGAVRVG